MYFDRIKAKLLAKDSMRRARPNAMLVSLVYLLLAGVAVVIPRIIGDPIVEVAEYLAMGYEMDEVLEYVLFSSPARIALFALVSFLLELYSGLVRFGFVSYSLRMARNEPCGYGNLFDGFQRPLRVLWMDLLTSLFTTLWGLLGMLPGMVVLFVGGFAASSGEGVLGAMVLGYLLMLLGGVTVMVAVELRYRLAPYLILDDPGCTARQSIRRSKEAMRGWKMELFTLDLSFLGWGLLEVLTAGILSVWVGPYQWATNANFYDAVMGRARAETPLPPTSYRYDPNGDSGTTGF